MSAEVLKMIKENDVKFVDFRFTDTRGKEQHVTIPSKLVFTGRHFRREELRDVLAAQPVFRRPFSRCGAGMGQFTIASNGDVFACPLSVGIPGHGAGNIREKSLLDIWCDDERWTFYRGGWKDEDLHLCGKCPSRGICNVGSHCRANCHHAHGDLMGPPLECLNDHELLGLKKEEVKHYIDTYLKDYQGGSLDVTYSTEAIQ